MHPTYQNYPVKSPKLEYDQNPLGRRLRSNDSLFLDEQRIRPIDERTLRMTDQNGLAAVPAFTDLKYFQPPLSDAQVTALQTQELISPLVAENIKAWRAAEAKSEPLRPVRFAIETGLVTVEPAKDMPESVLVIARYADLPEANAARGESPALIDSVIVPLNVDHWQPSHRFVSHILTDRHLYRPGQTAHFKGYLALLDSTGGSNSRPAADFFQRMTAGGGSVTLDLHVTDAGGQNIKELSRTLELFTASNQKKASEAKAVSAGGDVKQPASDAKDSKAGEEVLPPITVDANGQFSFDLKLPASNKIGRLGHFTVRLEPSPTAQLKDARSWEAGEQSNRGLRQRMGMGHTLSVDEEKMVADRAKQKRPDTDVFEWSSRGTAFRHQFLVEEFRTPEFDITLSRIAGPDGYGAGTGSAAPAASALDEKGVPTVEADSKTLTDASRPLCFGDSALFQTRAAYYSGGALPFTKADVSAAWAPGSFTAPPGFEQFTFERYVFCPSIRLMLLRPTL